MLVRGLKTAQIHALKLCAFHFRFHFVEFSSLFVPIAELGLVLFQFLVFLLASTIIRENKIF